MIRTPRAPRTGLSARRTSRGRCVVARAASAEVKEADSVPGVENGDPPPAKLRTIDDLPREKGMPLLGKLLFILDENLEISSLFEKHDTDAICLNMGPAGGYMIAIQDTELMQEASIAQLKNTYPKWPAGVEALILAQGKSLTNEEIRPWRAALASILAQGTVMRLQLPLIVSEFTDAVRGWAAGGEEVQFYKAAKRLTFSAACRAAIGDVLSRQELDQLFPTAVTLGNGVFSVTFGLKRGLPFTAHWRAHNASDELIEILSARIEKVVKEDRAALERSEGGKSTVVREVLATLESEGVDVTSDINKTVERLAKEVIGIMFAGTDTTSYTISRSMQWLAKHPEWLEALIEEQTRLKAEYGPELDQTALKKSAVAQAITQEVLRLTPPVRVLYRKAQRDIVVGDIAVPEGSTIVMSPRKSILSTGNGTKKFDPDYWLSENRTKCARNDDPANFVFGQGGRNCVGKNLAFVEAMTFVAILGREVSGIEMSQKEKDRVFFIVGDHPTGMPVKLKPQAP